MNSMKLYLAAGRAAFAARAAALAADEAADSDIIVK